MDSRQIAILLVSIVLGFILSLVITPIFCLFRKIFYVPLIRSKLVRTAVKKGHVVTAKLVDSTDVQRSNGSFGNTDTNESIGVYQYACNGKTYTHRVISRDRMPEELTLYYIKKPRKASSESELGLRDSNWFLYYLVIAIILVVVCYFLGVNNVFWNL